MVERHYEHARSIYREIMHRHGEARACLAQAAWKLEHDEHVVDFAKVHAMLAKAEETFEEWDSTYLQSKSLRLLAKVYLEMGQIYRAREHAERAAACARQIGDKQGESALTSDLGLILELIRRKSHNVFVFAKAFPLVAVAAGPGGGGRSGGGAEPIGPLTRYPSHFRQELLRNLESQRKVVHIHFDSLTRALLSSVGRQGCRVLHLSSDVYARDEALVGCEGAAGEVDWVPSAQLVELLGGGAKAKVDVAVLAMPKSRVLGELFAT